MADVAGQVMIAEHESVSYWLSYGGGVNSTALAILLVDGKLPQYEPWRIVFADTGDEKDQTYYYIEKLFRPWLQSHKKELEIAQPVETVYERWWRYGVTGSRLVRACTQHAKRYPIRDYIALNGGSLGSLIGIDADESNRAKERDAVFYPLVELDIGRDQCVEIIKGAGLPIPVKSGCWHCPFMRVAEILELMKSDPCRVAQIEKLENRATQMHGTDSLNRPRNQWGDHPVSWWRDRASQSDMFDLRDPTIPCDCYDGNEGE